jgi:putative glutamine amidotransferase
MSRPPLILVTPDIETNGKEFHDLSISLSANYQQALESADALPIVLAATQSRELISESIRHCDGVMLTGGDDIEPRLYTNKLPSPVKKTVEVTPDGGGRDLRELIVIDEVFRQRKPLLAICRGHQLVNIALGGTLVADIPGQKPTSINHRRMDKRSEVVHEVRLTRGSILAKITGKQTLGVNSTHHQAVARLAAPLKACAVSSDGIVESTELKPNLATALPFFLTVQFHPERLVGRYAEHQAIFTAFAVACANAKNDL